ncbi:copper ion binding [Arabis alpina]|uniref:Copper ion binding n=1 Tax=Arabis alpina TaxID=50452 RepID=A0A087HM18_ARAAL|nr:copper ion binding [Arabis alpina]
MLCNMRSSLSCVVLLIKCLELLSLSADAYKNYTVGESTGWFDIQERPSANYQKWADSKSFSLGDFLIFNTDSNHSVVQTYDFKTYKECDYNNGEDNSTTEWSGSNPSATSPVPVSVYVPLVKEGSNYFFSGNYDGEQCEFGQHFMINVTHGQGLPPALSSPDEDDETAPGPGQSSQQGDDEVAPDTIVPANFDHPKDIEGDDDDKVVKGSKSSSSITKCNVFCLVFMGFLASFSLSNLLMF